MAITSAIAVAAVGTAYQADQSGQQRRLASQAANANKIDQATAKKNADNVVTQNENAAASAAAKKQRDSLSALNSPDTRNGTVLTSPLGVPSTPVVGGKTLLGM